MSASIEGFVLSHRLHGKRIEPVYTCLECGHALAPAQMSTGTLDHPAKIGFMGGQINCPLAGKQFKAPRIMLEEIPIQK